MKETPLALVTGAAHRIGKNLALYLAKQGYALLLHYHRSGQAAENVAVEIKKNGVPVYLVESDLKKVDTADVLAAAIDGTGHELKLLVNSAGIMPRQTLGAITAAEWDDVMEINVRAPFLLAQMAYQKMGEEGLIVNFADAGARKFWTGYPAYVTSKAAIESLTCVLAKAFAPKVRVNAIAPGLVLIPNNMSAGEWEKMIARLPLRRAVELDEINRTVSYLIETPSITGQIVTIDGGWSLI